MDELHDNDGALPDTEPSVILVVEDEVLIRFVVADYLRECGFQILEAGNADEAVELLRTADLGIDLVFSDVHMPGTRDGFDLARWVQEHRPEIPVILTSGLARTAELSEDLCALGPIEPKPYNARALSERIHRLLQARAGRTGLAAVQPNSVRFSNPREA
jgi:CheY-like chemotaxis protein